MIRNTQAPILIPFYPYYLALRLNLIVVRVDT
jgi:hypothetical protein